MFWIFLVDVRRSGVRVVGFRSNIQIRCLEQRWLRGPSHCWWRHRVCVQSLDQLCCNDGEWVTLNNIILRARYSSNTWRHGRQEMDNTKMSEVDMMALSIISLVGVAVSLVALVFVFLPFIFFKSVFYLFFISLLSAPTYYNFLLFFLLGKFANLSRKKFFCTWPSLCSLLRFFSWSVRRCHSALRRARWLERCYNISYWLLSGGC